MPNVLSNVSDDEQERAATLLTLLEEHDDVDHLYTNAVFPGA